MVRKACLKSPKALARYVVVSWNLSDFNLSGCNSLIEHLASIYGWSFVALLQHVHGCCNELRRGWQLLCKDGCRSAILLPPSLVSSRVGEIHFEGDALSVGVETTALCSVYLPHAGHDATDPERFSSQLEATSRVILKTKKDIRSHISSLSSTTRSSYLTSVVHRRRLAVLHRKIHTIVAGDLNTKLPKVPNIVLIPSATLWSPEYSLQFKRQRLIIDFCRRHHLQIVSPCQSGSDTECHSFRNFSTHVSDMRDFIMMSSNIPCLPRCPFNAARSSYREILGGLRDHFPIGALLLAAVLGDVVTHRSSQMVAWEPRDDVAKLAYRTDLHQQFADDRYNDDGSDKFSLANMAATIHGAASRTDHCNRYSKHQLTVVEKNTLERLQAEFEISTGAQRDDVKRRLRNVRRGIRRRRIRATHPVSRPLSRQTAETLVTASGTVHNRTWWPLALEHYMCCKYHGDVDCSGKRRHLFHYFANLANSEGDDGLCDFEFEYFARAYAQLNCGKVPGQDDVVTEMLHMLPVSVRYHLFVAMRERFRSSHEYPLATWRDVWICFLAKCGGGCADFRRSRGIALISTLAKLYLATLVLIAEGLPLPVQCIEVCIFGFMQGVSVVDLTMPLQVLLLLCYEWQAEEEIHVMCGDVFAAFDMLTTETVVHAFTYRQLPARLVAGFLREAIEVQATGVFEGQCTASVAVNLGERQGSTDATFKWNSATISILGPLHSSWRERGMGVRLGRFVFTHLAWADNWYLLARSAEHLRTMASELTLAMLSCNLFWKQGSLEYLSPMANAEDSFPLCAYFPHWPGVCEFKGEAEDFCKNVPFPTAHRDVFSYTVHVPRVASSVQLGVVFHTGSTSEASWQHRRHLAMVAFDQDRKALCGKELSATERMHRYATSVPAIALFGCDGWVPSLSLFRSIRGFEGRLLRMIYRVKRPVGMKMASYMQHATRKARELYTKLGHALLEQRYCFTLLNAAAKLQRPQTQIQYQWFNAVINHRPHALWMATSELRRTDESYSGKRARQGAGHRRDWKQHAHWESVLVDRYGPLWREHLQSLTYPVKNRETKRDFSYSVLASLGFKVKHLKRHQNPQKVDNAEILPVRKRARVCFDDATLFDAVLDARQPQLYIRGDSKTVIDWINMKGFPQEVFYSRQLVPILQTLYNWFQTGFCTLCHKAGDWATWIPRESNVTADRLAFFAYTTETEWEAHNMLDMLVGTSRFRLSFDGSCREQAATVGYVLHGFTTADDTWRPILSGGVKVNDADSLRAEIMAAQIAIFRTEDALVQRSAAISSASQGVLG